ncbi:MAG TPA: transposase, partial [Polyangiales bacterium]|nr:transposase [Polyangiales bacterium]
MQLPTTVEELQALLNEERARVAASAQRIAELEKERDNLRASHERLRQELELFKRRLFIAKAERAHDAKQLELEYAQKVRDLDAMAGTLGIATDERASNDTPARDGKPKGKRTNNRGTGRRDLRSLPLEEERIEIADPHLEKLVEEGKVQRHGFDDSSVRLAHKRATKVRLVIARIRYKAVDAEGNADVITTAMPDEMLPGAMAAPSLAANVIMENVGKGLPLFRIEDACTRDGIRIDRATLSRWKKLVGDRLHSTVVEAMRLHARETAFCISTDATGVCVQPLYDRAKGGQPCKKGHFLVMIADRDHILFDYLANENGPSIYKLFTGFSGHVQADAKSVFNLLFADADEFKRKAPDDLEHDGCVRTEVGCWYHARRRFWEAAVCKSEVGREGLVRLSRIFELDASWKGEPPSEIKRRREQFLRPHVESFFAWVDQQRPAFKGQRGYTRTALEYANNQRDVLLRFFDDGRLVLTNNGA